MTNSAKAQTGGARARLPHFNDASTDLPALKELATHDQWVMWRNKRIEAPGKPVRITKYPMNANNGSSAKVNERETWASFAKCYDGAIKRGLMGVGFVLDEADGFTGLDLDKCVSDDGTIEPWAAEIVALGETYCEVSPSRKGLHFFIRGKVDHATKCDAAHVELYGNKRFLTVTGWHVDGAPDSINPAPRTIQAVLARAAQFRAPDEREATQINRDPRPLPERDDDPPYITFFRKDREEDDAKRARGEYVGWLKNAPRNDNAPAGGNFFRNVNDRACAETDRWAQALFPQAKRSGTGWRVSSKSLGRDLEEDISVTPQGIKDFGVHDMGDANGGRRTPINLVMEWGGHADPASAARWLCDQMGVTPESLGWTDSATEAPEPRRVHRTDDGTFIDADTGEILGDADAENVINMERRREKTSAPNRPTGAKPAPVKMETINAASLADKPVPEQCWLVPELIPAANVTLLTGDGGTGKSLLALQLAVAVAANGKWLGFYPTSGRVLFLSAEDELAELHRRLARMDTPLPALDWLDFAPLADRDAILAAPDKNGLLAATPLFGELRRLVDEKRPTLVVLDTLADLFGGDEIKKVQSRAFIAMLRSLALEFDTTILLLGHPSQSGLAKGSGTSGNTAWSNSVRSRLFFDRQTMRENGVDIESDPDIRVLKVMKANRAPKGGEIVMRYCRGVFVPEETTDGAVEGTQDQAQRAERKFLELLAQFTTDNRPVSDKFGANFAPKTFAGHPSAGGVTKTQFEQAMNRLFAAKKIRVDEVGPPSRRQRKLVLASTPSADAQNSGANFGTDDEHDPDG